ncbi:hypothetical protein J5N97_003477 [Dioscorea zingiberensis]|uniref:Uncharacterized protein n=1 Tax=Dioscorea zingiberensis TaxID=325984 RepID=A0A9D5D4R3_9LILI|nr:hypothetical protein J5N97_003477 [Dioscorea zingiberensis]
MRRPTWSPGNLQESLVEAGRRTRDGERREGRATLHHEPLLSKSGLIEEARRSRDQHQSFIVKALRAIVFPGEPPTLVKLFHSFKHTYHEEKGVGASIPVEGGNVSASMRSLNEIPTIEVSTNDQLPKQSIVDEHQEVVASILVEIPILEL